MRLDNGLSLALLSRPGASKAAISVRVMAGSHDEPPEHPGLAHFLEHLLFLGSEGYGPEQGLMAFVQACGGQVNASTQARHTDYFCEVPAPRLAEVLVRLIDLLAYPLFDRAAQRREREVVHAEFLARGNDPDTLVSCALAQALPAGHRCGDFLAGNRDTLAVDSEDFQQALRGFHRRFYRAAQISLVLVGPQPLEALRSLAELYAGHLPVGHLCSPSPAPALLPLRARRLRMTLPGAASLHLGFALELADGQGDAPLDQALAYLLFWLADGSPAGLLGELRAAGLCSGLQARVLYRHGQQALLALSFAATESTATSRATIAAAVKDWLSFFAEQGTHERLRDSYRALLGWRLRSLEPLALARYWQECLVQGRDPALGLTAEGQRALAEVLTQMRSAERRISLFASPEEVDEWPCGGFPLRMVADDPSSAASRRWAWCLPAANPLLGPGGSEPALGAPARLRWLQPAAAADDSGRAALFGCCRLAEPVAAEPLLALAEVRLGELQVHAGQVGVSLRFWIEGEALQLSLQGPGALLPRVLAQALARLFDAPAPAPSPAPTASAELPIRQLLRRLPELFATPTAQEPAVSAAPRLCLAGWEAVGAGLSQAEQAQVERLFSRVMPLDVPRSIPVAAAGRHWLDLQLPGDEAALLLFCPQPSADALTEAGWRLLAQHYQGAFYRRLRSELQLGYALFCGYRQVAGRRGLLFAVQSPHASPAQILEHIERFLADQGEGLATLAEAELAAVAGELGQQLQGRCAAVDELAESHWQQHLAGLPPGHEVAVQRELARLGHSDLLQLHRRLCQAQGGWHLLASGGPAGAGTPSPR